MKRFNKNTHKTGFTLVELIVVLVILAILAAMLVPALTGYIRRARNEKDIELLYDLRTAAQAALIEMYGEGTHPGGTTNPNKNNTNFNVNTWDYAGRIEDLMGLPRDSFRTKHFAYLFIVQIGRYSVYHDTNNEMNSYNVYRIYFQKTADSDLFILDDNGLINYTQNPGAFNGSREYIDINGDGTPSGGGHRDFDRIYAPDVATGVVGIQWGGPTYTTTQAAMDAIERGTYKTS